MIVIPGLSHFYLFYYQLTTKLFFILRPLQEDTEVHSPKPAINSSGKKGRSGTHKNVSKRVKDELWIGKYS